MSTVYLILALIIAIIAVVFALQNVVPVTVTFFVWQVDGSLSLVILVTLIIGVLVGWLFVAPSLVKSSFQGSSRRKRIAALEEEIDEHKASLENLQQQVKTLELELLARSQPAHPVEERGLSDET